jgi:prophage regulatory protein
MQSASSLPTKILRRRAVVERVGLSSTTIWRLVRAGRFPAPVQLSAQAIGWREHDIEAWLTSREVSPEGARPSPNPRAHRAVAAHPDA